MIDFLIIFFLVLINGVLAASELAVVSSRTSRLQAMAEEGVSGATRAAELAGSPSHFLSTVQIGITLVGILAGAFGGATVAGVIANAVQDIPGIGAYADAVGVGAVVLVTTYLSLVIGELTPKRIALRNPERIAAMVAPSMDLLARATSPAVWLLNRSSDMVLRLFRQTAEPESGVSTEEIKMLLEEGRNSGVIEPEEEQMIKRVFRLADRRVKALMTPRTEVSWIDLQADQETLRASVMHNGFSRYPVAEGALDNIRGIVLAKDLLAYCMHSKAINLQEIVRPALFIPESMSPIQVIERFKATHSKIGIVIDEYGGVEGITTVDDVMEAIVGDIQDRSDNEETLTIQQQDGSWLVDAHLPLDEFQAIFDVPSLPEDAGTQYHTVAGLVMDVLGHIPETGALIRWQNVQLRIVRMDGRRVEQVLVIPDDGLDAS